MQSTSGKLVSLSFAFTNFKKFNYSSGGELIKLLQERCGQPYAPDKVLRMFYQTCRAVAHMHKQTPPVIHRDLKVPKNFITLCTVRSVESTVVALYCHSMQTEPMVLSKATIVNSSVILYYQYMHLSPNSLSNTFLFVLKDVDIIF